MAAASNNEWRRERVSERAVLGLKESRKRGKEREREKNGAEWVGGRQDTGMRCQSMMNGSATVVSLFPMSKWASEGGTQKRLEFEHQPKKKKEGGGDKSGE